MREHGDAGYVLFDTRPGGEPYLYEVHYARLDGDVTRGRATGMKRLFGAFVLAAALLGAACGLPGRPPLAVALPDARRSPVGCWQLHSVGGEDPFLPGRLRVRFDSARANASDASRRVVQVERADTLPPRRFQLAWWAPYERVDSVYAILGDGFTGLQLRLGLSGDSIAGTAYRFADTPHFRSSGKLSGKRQACRSEMLAPADSSPAP